MFIDFSFIQEVPNCQNYFNNLNLTNNSYLLKVTGSSMSPAIKENLECICSEKEYYKVGDIVTFSFLENKNITTVLHRIIEVVNSTSFITRGDNNNFIDSLIIPQEAVVCAIENKHRINF